MTVLTAGTFDLFHEGHVNLLRECWRESSEGGKVVVVLNRDDFVEHYKGQKPIMSYFERRAVLLSCRYVDEVIPNAGGDTLRPLLSRFPGAKLVVGSDWESKDYYAQIDVNQDYLDARDIEVVYVPYTHTISTSKIKERLCKQLLSAQRPAGKTGSKTASKV